MPRTVYVVHSLSATARGRKSRAVGQWLPEHLSAELKGGGSSGQRRHATLWVAEGPADLQRVVVPLLGEGVDVEDHRHVALPREPR